MVKEFLTQKEKRLQKLLAENLDCGYHNFKNDNLLTKGQLLHFNGDFTIKTLISDHKSPNNKYGVFKTMEGFDVSFSQIARRNNGLNIPGSLFSDRVMYFYRALAIEGVITLQITDIKTISSSFGNSRIQYYLFKIHKDHLQESANQQECNKPQNNDFPPSIKLRLKQALRLIIRANGINFLGNQTLQFLLSDIVDYSDEPASKIIIREYCINDDFRNLIKENSFNNKKYHLDIIRRKAVKDYGFNEDIVLYVIKALAFALEIDY